jgi:hypothetical protein
MDGVLLSLKGEQCEPGRPSRPLGPVQRVGSFSNFCATFARVATSPRLPWRALAEVFQAMDEIAVAFGVEFTL